VNEFDLTAMLPEDWRQALLVGRIDRGDGPTPVVVRGGVAYDVSASAPTVAALLAGGQAASIAGEALGALDALGLAPADAEAAGAKLLAPIDLQCVKAAGVTFAVSAVERVIEERARGDAGAAATLRARLAERMGGDIRAVVPGSDEAARLKAGLIEEGLWSQYLEVAIGPDAEVFTKAAVLSSVGAGAAIGVRSDSGWNNPEPEIVIVCDPAGAPIGATLGNDVNLRDFEGRSALLLGKAKDNNASCALGPFVRLFDDGFTMDDVRAAQVELVIDGPEGYRLEGASEMSQISRDPVDLCRQTMSEHQYPDGFVLFLGTLFAPVQDRDAPGRGFTHREGDIVRIATPKLGRLENRVTTSKAAPPWTFGIGALFANLAARGLLGGATRG
jgi:fumarylacetoacetate (FAA) hydrolase family protein